MINRESKKSNDLFFTCALIIYIARKTKNKPKDIVNLLKKQNITKIYELADIYHSDNIDKVSDDFIDECDIKSGTFDNISICEYSIPTYWDIAKVYKRLILMLSSENNTDIENEIINVFNSFVSDLIEDYNSSFYYDNPNLILETYKNGKVIEE